jgi:tetratricopeptide (TPR) repeat protein
VAVCKTFLKEVKSLESAQHFEKAVHRQPDGLWPNFLHGQCCYAQGRFSEAVTAFSTCIGAAPDSWGCFHNRSVAFAALAQYRQALTDSEHAIRLEPHAVEPHLQRALLRFHSFDLGGACADLVLVTASACRNSTSPELSAKSRHPAPASTASLR